jgi:hypothetical protein
MRIAYPPRETANGSGLPVTVNSKLKYAG